MQESTPGRPATIRLHSAVPAFLVPDVNATAKWYAEHLGFETAGIFPRQGPASWASLQRDGAEIMLQRLEGYEKPDLYRRRDGGVWNAYIRMRGVHALYATVRDRPFIRMPLARQPYGDWEFEVVDLNGYVLVFGGDETVAATEAPCER
jgi:catechol 2,3-dioxygenase-like lactoylglutathione lyase family enzyme